MNTLHLQIKRKFRLFCAKMGSIEMPIFYKKMNGYETFYIRTFLGEKWLLFWTRLMKQI